MPIKDYSAREKTKAQRNPIKFWQARRNKRRLIRMRDNLHEQLTPTHFTAQSYNTKNSSLKKYLLLLGGLVVLWVGLMIYLPYFKIKTVEIVGDTNSVEPDQVIFLTKNAIKDWYFIPFSNYFFVNSKHLENLIEKQFFLLNSVIITKEFPSTLRVDLRAKQIFATVYASSGIYYIDDTGSIIRQVFFATGTVFSPVSSTATQVAANMTTDIPSFSEIRNQFGDHLIIYSDYNITGKTNSIIFSNKILQNLKSLLSFLSTAGFGSVNSIAINGLGREGVTVNLNKPYYLLFDLLESSSSIESQVNSLRAILGSASKPSSYVDLRFGDHVYSK